MSTLNKTATAIQSKLEQAKSALKELSQARIELIDAIRPVLTPDSPVAIDPSAGAPECPAQSDVSNELDLIISLIAEECQIIRSVLGRIEA